MEEKHTYTREDFEKDPKVMAWIKAAIPVLYGGDEEKAWESILRTANKHDTVEIKRIEHHKDPRQAAKKVQVHLSIKKK